MKKLFKAFIVLLIVVSVFPATTSAEENDDISYFFSNYKEISPSNGAIKSFTYYSQADKKSYQVNIYKMYSEVVDIKTNDIIVSGISYNRSNDSIIMQQPSSIITLIDPSDYDVWPNSYTNMGRNEAHINYTTQTTVSSILGFLVTQIGNIYSPAAGNIAGAFAEFLSNLAIEIYNERYDGLELQIQMMFNVYCTTYAKTRYEYWTLDGLFVKRYSGKQWLLDPYDPMSAYACKVIAGIY